MSTALNLTLPLPLAISVMLGCMALAALAARALGRRHRHVARGEVSGLRDLLTAYVTGRVDARRLLGAVRGAPAGAFWTALETRWPRLGYVVWLDLSRALERNPHSRAERRALRDDSPWRRALAARRLGLLRSELSRRALWRAMARGPELVTLAAVRSLARYRDRRALRWLLRHPGALARRPPPALAGLLRSFGRGAWPDLAGALETDSLSPMLERAVVEVIGMVRYRPAIALVERRLDHPEPEVRVAAACALGRLGADGGAFALLKALNDEAWPVRAQAARALGRIRAPVAADALVTRLSDPSWWVRRHAAYALLGLGEPGWALLEREAKGSPDRYARDMAREALESRTRRTA